jgi:acetyltransferase-like isoleucine patch superfamily enzyme
MAQFSTTRLIPLLYRLRHRGAIIGQGCYIRRDTVIAPGVEIGQSTCIYGATLFPKTKIGVNNRLDAHACVGASQLGAHCTIQDHARISNATLEGNSTIQTGCVLDQVVLGAWSYIARETVLNDVRLGRFCSIGPRTIIGAGEHPTDLISTSPVFYSDRGQCGPGFASATTFTERRTVTIGHDVWIGAHVFIRDGVSIGNGAIVAAGAVVARDIPPYAVVGGVPAKPIRSRFHADIVARLETLAWWNWDEAKLAQAQPHIAQNNPEKFLAWAESPHTS